METTNRFVVSCPHGADPDHADFAALTVGMLEASDTLGQLTDGLDFKEWRQVSREAMARYRAFEADHGLFGIMRDGVAIMVWLAPEVASLRDELWHWPLSHAPMLMDHSGSRGLCLNAAELLFLTSIAEFAVERHERWD